MPGSLAVKDGRIAAVGDDVGPARARIDARGLTLAPGIIDLHTHFDAQLLWDCFATPSVALGVTSVVIGNCGFTIAPCRATGSRPDAAQPHPRRRACRWRRCARASTGTSRAIRNTSAARTQRHGAERGLVRRSLLGAHLRAGRGRFQTRRHQDRGRGDEAPRDRGAARRRGRLLHLDAGAAQRRERHPHALAPGRRARAAGADRRARRSRQRRVHAHQGHDHDGAVAGAALARATAGR